MLVIWSVKKVGVGWGGGGPPPNFFWPFGPHIGLKIRGTQAPRAPPLDLPLVLNSKHNNNNNNNS